MYKLTCTGAGGSVDSSANVQVIQDSDKDGVFDDRDKCPDTPLGTKVNKDGCPFAVCKVITLDLKFAFDKAVINPDDYEQLKAVAVSMMDFDTATVLIEGHTDSKGTTAYNMKLSQRRADAVRNFLLKEHGITAARLTSKGLGEAKPVTSNDTEEGRARNRRVDAVFTCH
jgi:OOP family OmpA-OmpF porin